MEVNSSLGNPFFVRRCSQRRSQKKRSLASWETIRNTLLFGQMATDRVEAVVDGDTQEIWPKTAAWFLGPKAENNELLKELVTTAIDQHVEFRKFKYFPLDPNYVNESIIAEASFQEAVNKIRKELLNLSKRLNNSVPFFNFRSQGHMLWDTTIASNVGYIAALLYNQNNVASMASGVTLQLEREVARELCQMVGYKVVDSELEHTTLNPASWGHLPNGGTVGNIEAMWAARCLKFNALAIRKMMREKFKELRLEKVLETFTFKSLSNKDVLLKNANVWELLNIPVDEAIDMFDKLLKECQQIREDITFDLLFRCVKNCTMEEIGGWEFFDSLKDEYEEIQVRPSSGKWFVSGSRHYSWDKGANILGLGRKKMEKISVDENCRMDTKELTKALEECLEKKIPVVGVTVVFGTTQEGAVDALDKILEIRKQFEAKGLTFYIHIDGAWGGYFASCLVDESNTRMSANTYTDKESKGNTMPRKLSTCHLKRANTNTFLDAKLSQHFIAQLSCMHLANSITLDPHKSGFCPYPAGGLLYRNGNIRKFLAQKAAYVNHGSGKNEEINLFGIDGSKPGAASAGVWLSHKVIGLHDTGYGLLLQQCTFSAGVMYALWTSLEHEQDPFTVIPGIPVKESFKEKWPNSRIRREILDAETGSLLDNDFAMEFIKENGPDTLINCVSINWRSWNRESGTWENNKSLQKQREFLDKFYMRCSHSFEKPAMVDRGIQVILNSTVWNKKSHSGAYKNMKQNLGLDDEDEGDIGVIINTSMSPWLRAQKTFKRIGFIIRNELYNAYGAVHDEPQHLHLVSPSVTSAGEWNGNVFAELEASFSNPSLMYHVIGKFVFPDEDLEEIRKLASKAFHQETITRTDIPLRLVTRNKMKVFDLMTGGDLEVVNLKSKNDSEEASESSSEEMEGSRVQDKLKKYSDDHFTFEEISMPEIEVTAFFMGKEGKIGAVETRVKLKRVMRYQHLSRDFVDEKDYPPSQEYFLYADDKNAYISHCPNRWPDFQQQIQLDEMPRHNSMEKDASELYQEALQRGVIVYLPQVESGGRPLKSRRDGRVCKDPLTGHLYNALSWSDQGAFTGEMIPVTLKFYGVGRRWFSGKKINKNYSKSNFPHLFASNGQQRKEVECSSDECSSDDFEDDDVDIEKLANWASSSFISLPSNK
eukprot:GFUD01014760.1.p1 GENE.GFUD01014760.1~~GFUD01014760.1.p1  ORF type:complete len:1163 (-),score=280.67 GFUD01014760.1:114-3602(-)